MKFFIRSGFLTVFSLLFVFTVSTSRVQALTAFEIQDLNTQAVSLQEQLQSVQVAADTMCSPLVQANQAARDLVNSITAVNDSLVAPLQVDADILSALEALLVTSAGLSSEALRLSTDMQLFYETSNKLTIKEGLNAMLQLSADIGTMADRIGEMADNILVMSDNIGLMADRILVTQEIQGENLRLTGDTLLQTQNNIMTLVSYVETQSFNLSLDELSVKGNFLLMKMMAATFTPFGLKYQTADLAEDVREFRLEVEAVNQQLIDSGDVNTFYVDSSTLLKMEALNIMMKSIGDAVDGYVIMISGLQMITSSPSLYTSLKSMLQLSADIGLMANRIMEMSDQILKMADNIGLAADWILSMQLAQAGYLQMVQGSVLNFQEFAVQLIVSRNLG